jgi:hypothetical protein
MTTAQRMLDWARSTLGYVEGPRDNETIFGSFTGYNFQPWCGSWVKTGFHDIGLKGEPSSVYTPSGAAAYKAAGRWIERNGPVQPGDVVFFDWNGSTSTSAVDHVGIVEAINADGTITTIEGNTSPTNAGSQSNGGGVYRRRRPRSVIAGFGRPRYSATDARPPAPQEDDDVADIYIENIETPDAEKQTKGSVWVLTGTTCHRLTPQEFLHRKVHENIPDPLKVKELQLVALTFSAGRVQV